MTTIYGIKNCDTVKKALKWLDQAGVNYTFHDFRVQGFDQMLWQEFTAKTDWQNLINKRSTSYRNLDDEIKQNLNIDNATEAVLEQPTLIKRPVLIHDDQLHLGFKAADYQAIFAWVV